MEMTLAFERHTLTQQTVGDGGEERLHAEDEGLGTTGLKVVSGSLKPVGTAFITPTEIVGGQGGDEAAADLPVREVEKVGVAAGVVILDSQVPALINHRERPFHIGLVIHEHLGLVVFPYKLVDILLAMRKQTDKIGRSARGKPIVVHLHL